MFKELALELKRRPKKTKKDSTISVPPSPLSDRKPTAPHSFISRMIPVSSKSFKCDNSGLQITISTSVKIKPIITHQHF